jgi:tetratricopeptide (TPR) repeat protein
MTRKPTAYILLFVTACALLAGCGRSVSDADRLLARIDSLADVDPDSADVLLKPTPSPSPKGWEKEEVALLLRIKVDDKLYRPVTHYRDTILQLVSYFEQRPKVLPSVLGSTGPALPYLYAGRIFADLGDAPQALDYYQRALDVQPARQMENGKMRIENEDARRLAKQRNLLCSLIGNIFSYQYLFEDAILLLEKATYWALQANDTSAMIFNYRDLAEQFKYMNMPDSSFFYYEYALLLASQSKNINMANDVMMQMARLYVSEGRHRDALPFIRPALNVIDSADISPTYAIASDVYKGCGIRDSALFCYNKLLRYGNIFGKHHAYQELSEIAVSANDIKTANNYYREYKLLDDSIRKMDNAETVARMHAAYNYQKHEKEAAQLKIANAHKEKIIIISGFVIAILVGIVYILVNRNTQNKLRNARQQQLLKEIQDSLKTEYIVQRKRSDNQEDSLDTFKETNIYKTFLLLSQSKDRNVSIKEWDEFSHEFNNCFPNFKLKLSGIFNLSTKQYRVCMLRKVGFGTTTICYLACYEKASVYSIYKRLYFQATGKKGSTADFDNLLKAL